MAGNGNPAYYVKVVYISLLESIFSEETLYDDEPNPWRIFFDEQGNILPESQICITDNFMESWDKTDPRPVIVVKRTDISIVKNFIGEMMNAQGWGGQTAKYTSYLSMNMSFSCYSRNHVECEDISTVVWSYLHYFSVDIRKWTAVENVTPPTLGTPEVSRQPDSKIDLFKCDVSTTITIPLFWEVKREGILKKIDSICARKFKDAEGKESFFHSLNILNQNETS